MLGPIQPLPDSAAATNQEASSVHETEIALKYLDLSRAEILERLKLSNQFLILYLGGISALIGWFFSAKDGILPQSILPAVATGLSFLACSLSWVLSENERMIELLARYQVQELSKSLSRSSSILLWEEFPGLTAERPSSGAMLMHMIMINAPNVALTVAAAYFPSQLPGYARETLIAIASALSSLSCWISFLMIDRRTAHRTSSQSPKPIPTDLPSGLKTSSSPVSPATGV